MRPLKIVGYKMAGQKFSIRGPRSKFQTSCARVSTFQRTSNQYHTTNMREHETLFVNVWAKICRWRRAWRFPVFSNVPFFFEDSRVGVMYSHENITQSGMYPADKMTWTFIGGDGVEIVWKNVRVLCSDTTIPTISPSTVPVLAHLLVQYVAECTFLSAKTVALSLRHPVQPRSPLQAQARNPLRTRLQNQRHHQRQWQLLPLRCLSCLFLHWVSHFDANNLPNDKSNHLSLNGNQPRGWYQQTLHSFRIQLPSPLQLPQLLQPQVQPQAPPR